MILFINTVSDSGADNEKFNRIYDRYYEYAYKVAYNVLKDEKHSEDAVQTAFVNVWRTVGDVSEEDNIKAWIAVIVKNTAINILRRTRLENKIFIDIDDDVIYSTVPDFSNDPAEITVDNDSVEYIYKQMRELKSIYSDVLVMRYKFGCTPEKIAQMFCVPVKTVYTRLERGKKLLMEKLYSEGGGSGERRKQKER